ncbi:MAG: glucoamylase family protein [Lewinella sp.]
MKPHITTTLLPLLFGLLLFASLPLAGQSAAITGVTATAYDHHIELGWTPSPDPDVTRVAIYGSTEDGGFAELGTVRNSERTYIDFLGEFDISRSYYVEAVSRGGVLGAPSETVAATTFEMTDDQLLDMVQEYTLRYFYENGDPTTGMALERNQPGIVTTGGTGFGIMGMLVGVQRGWLPRRDVLNRITKIVDFLLTVPRFKGAFSHWLNPNTGEVIPFSETDDGGDLVETAFLIQGLLTARQFYKGDAKKQVRLRSKIDQIYRAVDWNGYRQPGKTDVLTWHYSNNFGWALDLQIRGFNEAQIVYILAAATPNLAHRIPASLYRTGWADSGNVTAEPYVNDDCYYGIPMIVGEERGGPLFFSHYSYMGFDPRNKRDEYANYFQRNTNHTLINYRHSLVNPYDREGYGPDTWGLTASDNPFGYRAHEPESAVTDNGTITPTAALSSMPYTPERSLVALKHFYRDLGEEMWGPYGFYDAFNPGENWFADSYLAIDQGPIIGMIENYRSGFLWETFMSSEEIGPALTRLGFEPDATPITMPAEPDLTDETALEDFENATADLPWVALDGAYSGPIPNPDKSTGNASDFVASYQKQAGTAFSLFRAQLTTPLDLSVNNQIAIQIKTDVPTRLLMKLEGGGAAIERGVDLDVVGEWATYTFDFSDAACDGGLTDIILFFDPGVEASDDTYFFDNLNTYPIGGCAGDEPDPTIIDDFECQQNATYGVPGIGDIAVVDNPDKRGINRSEQVGQYTDRTGAYHALVIDYDEPIDLSSNPVICMKVWAPKTGTLLFKLEGDGAAYEEAREITETETWVEVCVDFTDQIGTDYDKLVFFINAGVEDAAGDIYYLDDISRREAISEVPQMDPCADVAVDDTYLDDFECQRNITYSIGGEFLRVFDNPDDSPGSGNTSAKVGVFADQRGPFNALAVEFDGPLDLTVNNQLSVDIWAPVAGDILFKLEGNDPPQTRGQAKSAPPLEILQTIPVTQQWVTYQLDLSAAAGMGFTRLVFFFGAGVDNPSINTYLFDNLRLTRQPYVSDCVATFETADETPLSGTYFNNGSVDGTEFVVTENPVKGAGNFSDQVGVFTEASDGTQPFAGLALGLNAPIRIRADNKVATMKVLMPEATTVAIKLEGGDLLPAGTGDIFAEYTTPGAWQELTFDLGTAVEGASYETLTLIPNGSEIPVSDQTYYFDDITVGGGSCGGTTGLIAAPSIEALKVFPNPVTDELTIDNPGGAVRFTLTSMLGQRVKQLVADPQQTRVYWEISLLPAGTYVLTAEGVSGRTIARSMVIKR